MNPVNPNSPTQRYGRCALRQEKRKHEEEMARMQEELARKLEAEQERIKAEAAEREASSCK